MWIVIGPMYAIGIIFFLVPYKIADWLYDLHRKVGNWFDAYYRGYDGCSLSISVKLEVNLKWFDQVISKARTLFETGFHFPSGAVLFLGIIMEDIPQIII